jgi:hypothetical protein
VTELAATVACIININLLLSRLVWNYSEHLLHKASISWLLQHPPPPPPPPTNNKQPATNAPPPPPPPPKKKRTHTHTHTHKVKNAYFSSLIKVVQTCVRSISDHDYVEPCLPNLKSINYCIILYHWNCWWTIMRKPVCLLTCSINYDTNLYHSNNLFTSQTYLYH